MAQYERPGGGTPASPREAARAARCVSLANTTTSRPACITTVNRYYDPDTAAYLSPDPLGLTPSPHHYAYVPNPVSWADPLGLNGEQPTATQIRNSPGTAGGGENLPEVTGPWLRGSAGNAGRIPGQIADNLRGQSFKSFDDFREAFWKEVGKDPDLSAQFSPSNVTRMGDGHSPFTAASQAYRGGRTYVLHHLTPIWDGGGVYDMDNLAIITSTEIPRGNPRPRLPLQEVTAMPETDPRRERAIELVRDVRYGRLPDDQASAKLDELEQLIAHPQWADLLFYQDPELSDEQAVDAALAYRPFAL